MCKRMRSTRQKECRHPIAICGMPAIHVLIMVATAATSQHSVRRYEHRTCRMLLPCRRLSTHMKHRDVLVAS